MSKHEDAVIAKVAERARFTSLCHAINATLINVSAALTSLMCLKGTALGSKQLIGGGMNAQQKARELLSRYWNGVSLSIDPTVIAQAEGVQVLEVEMPAGDSGEYLGEAVKGLHVMRVNKNESPLRKRFTIAHELAHHVLGHGPRPRDGSKQYSAYNYDPKEADANRFAAELLMPEAVVNRLVFDNGIADVSKLASVMKVSEVAMKYRLKNLGIVP